MQKCILRPAATGLSKDFWPHSFDSTWNCLKNCLYAAKRQYFQREKKKEKEHVKKVFLESRCRQPVNILSSPDVCWLREDLCLPVAPLTSLSDSLADSWGAAVTLRLLSFFHMPHHLAQRPPHPSLGEMSFRELSPAPTRWRRRPARRGEELCPT